MRLNEATSENAQHSTLPSSRRGFPDHAPSVNTHKKSEDMLRCENEAGVTSEEEDFAVTGSLCEGAALLEQLYPFLVTEDI